ncbi:hypothetical protein [Endozoicomonas sp. SESOKO2]|uniref:hypothetical protein n=1 Tax=Endozoicomonas sp. SESOKO2 TaxID=2828743 RepID=UPI002147F7E5|nr:hypothetical protein [Endozoicomonas sp. SESOKO2]
MLADLLVRYKKQGAFLDTNLLVLYLVGKYEPEFVPKFKRTAMYTEQDFHWLNEYVSQFSRIVVTPQVLAETWNFLEKINEIKFKEFIVSILPTLYEVNELYIEKDEVISAEGFSYMGITDISVILAAKSLDCLVLTDDLRAYSYFASHEVMAININHLRQV